MDQNKKKQLMKTSMNKGENKTTIQMRYLRVRNRGGNAVMLLHLKIFKLYAYHDIMCSLRYTVVNINTPQDSRTNVQYGRVELMYILMVYKYVHYIKQ